MSCRDLSPYAEKKSFAKKSYISTSEFYFTIACYVEPLCAFRICTESRTLHNVDRWKATEFCQVFFFFFFIHWSICFENNFAKGSVPKFHVVLCSHLTVAYSTFLSFILWLCPLLFLFVQHFSNFYGKEMLAYNVHGLVHLPGEVKLHGCLDNISSFTFENLGASQNFPLQQIIRLSERIPD